MEGSVLSFLKAEWKVSDTGSAHAEPLVCNLQSRVRTHAVLVIGLYELLGNPTT
jgi:hypothetical protein